jgi:hypothetical protein
VASCLGSAVVQQFLQQCVLDTPGFEQLQRQLQQELMPAPAPTAAQQQQLGTQLNLTPQTHHMQHTQHHQQRHTNQQHAAAPVIVIDDDDDFADLDWEAVDQLCNQHQQQSTATAAPAGTAGPVVSALQHLQQHNPGIMQDAPAEAAPTDTAGGDGWDDWDLAELEALEAAAIARAAAHTLADAPVAALAAGTGADAAAMPGASNVTYWHAAGEVQPKKVVRFAEDAPTGEQQQRSRWQQGQQGQQGNWGSRPTRQPTAGLSAFEELTSVYVRPDHPSSGRTGKLPII